MEGNEGKLLLYGEKTTHVYFFFFCVAKRCYQKEIGGMKSGSNAQRGDFALLHGTFSQHAGMCI